MSEWVHTTWGDVVALQRGYDITKDIQALDGAVPVISSSGVSSHHDVAMSDGPGVIIGRKGTLGRVHYSAGPFWPHDTTLWVQDFKGNVPRYVYYALKTIDPSFLNVGSASPTLNRNHIYPLSVDWPLDRANQRAIAEVLVALDGKIAANENRFRRYDDLTQTMFEQASRAEPVVESTFADVAKIAGGGTPHTAVSSHWGGSISWATPKDLTALAAPYLRTTARCITASGLAACSSELHPAGSILMTSRATIGAFAVTTMPVAVNQGFIVVNATEPNRQWWLFHDMRARVGEFLSFANGATFLELPRGKFRNLPIFMPDDAVVRQFDAEVAPLHASAIAVVGENERLTATRDELLPLLISGKLRLKDAEKVVEEVV